MILLQYKIAPRLSIEPLIITIAVSEFSKNKIPTKATTLRKYIGELNKAKILDAMISSSTPTPKRSSLIQSFNWIYEQDPDNPDVYNKKISGYQVGDETKTYNDLTDEQKGNAWKNKRTEDLTASLPNDASYVEVNVAKNRNGQTGIARFFFFKDYVKFEEPPAEWEAAMADLAKED